MGPLNPVRITIKMFKVNTQILKLKLIIRFNVCLSSNVDRNNLLSVWFGSNTLKCKFNF